MHRLATLCLLVATSAAAAQPVYDIYIVTGQSNARPGYARGVFDELVASGASEHPVLFTQRHSGNSMVNWVDGPRGHETLGPNFLTDLWSPDDEAELSALIDRLGAFGAGCDIAGFFWFQGEADTGHDSELPIYQRHFFYMLNKLQVAYGLDHRIPFVITVIDYNGDDDALAAIGRTPEDVEAVRQTQFDLADQVPYGTAYDSRGWPRLDVWHVGSFDDPDDIYRPVRQLGAAEADRLLELPHPLSLADMNADGVHDLSDVMTFIYSFRLGRPIADLAAPVDVFDLNDVQTFANAFIGR
ncbi:MAG: hypothetical protein H6810_03755 [Phycisphaeraceae bacterium]|nr:MAG: hypothetical protein H6810_03755 [Phycisphaeraceae bacterium]